MREVLETAIKVLVNKIDTSVDANDALKFTQAALNLAHTAATFNLTKQEGKV